MPHRVPTANALKPEPVSADGVPMTQLQAERFRLVTRSDFDGLVCAVLLKQLDMLDDIKFVHPKDMQDGKVEIGAGDITTNLPYVPGVHIAFDHHHSRDAARRGPPGQPRHRPGRRVGRARRLRPLRRRGRRSPASRS